MLGPKGPKKALREKASEPAVQPIVLHSVKDTRMQDETVLTCNNNLAVLLAEGVWFLKTAELRWLLLRWLGEILGSPESKILRCAFHHCHLQQQK